MIRVTLSVDALAPQPGGIGRYTWELARGLVARDDVAVEFFGRGQVIADPSLLISGAPLPPRPNPIRRWLDRHRLSSSIVHGPNYFLPSFADGGIITVHDLSVFHYPETHPQERVVAFERRFLKSLSRASHVITDSETVRAELMTMFAVDAGKVSAIPLGVEPSFSQLSAAQVGPALAALGLVAGEYALCVSTLEPRKKIAELLQAWRLLPPSLRKARRLVLCGGPGWRNAQLRAEVERGIAEGWLRHLGFVDEGLLPTLYGGAALFIYPSIYEGFGLPPVEAMACGTPVMVSDRSCLPEVCGDGALYVDPDDVVAFSTAIADGLEDKQWQAASVRRGRARARQYTWEKCVDATIKVYYDALEGRPIGRLGSPVRPSGPDCDR